MEQIGSSETMSISIKFENSQTNQLEIDCPVAKWKMSIDGRGYSKPFGVSSKYCQIVHHSDGYDYLLGESFSVS